ncbi:AAA family ATPase [Thalassospira sp. CH_XMU1458]|uniref:AAA family ATPase n=1 Tax=Thalassospira sp. CH_XMU1458 TaxID=3107776 RepID=UPI00300D7E91
MLNSIYVDNFKALVDFELRFEKTTFLVGLNGAGKSSVLQFIDFVSSVSKGKCHQWLDDRDWSPVDLNSKLKRKLNIEFEIRFELGVGEGFGEVIWKASFNRAKMRCTQESFEVNGKTVARVSDGIFYNSYETNHAEKIKTEYEGSYVFQLKDSILENWPGIFATKQFLRNMQVLDSLSPQSLRKKSRESSGTIGLGGERLSALIHEMSESDREKLHDLTKKFYSNITFKTKSLRSGWKEIWLTELYQKSKLETAQQHINDGTLRILAILALLIGEDNNLIVLDEIENGINPELVGDLIKIILNSKHQVLSTTHSPIILNYLPDESAKVSVQYLYRRKDGAVKSVPLFGIPSMIQKLRVMGPGEVFADTDLRALNLELFESDKDEQG